MEAVAEAAADIAQPVKIARHDDSKAPDGTADEKTDYNADVAAKHLPFYVYALFKVFPWSLSPRQFRLAYKTLLRITAPLSPLSATHSDLPGVLLELVHHLALHAHTTPLPTDPTSPANAPKDGTPPLSEQAVLTLTLLDSLPFLPIDLLLEWLPICADLLYVIPDAAIRERRASDAFGTWWLAARWIRRGARFVSRGGI